MMGKLKKPNIKIEHIIDSSNLFYQDLLGYRPEQTFLQQVPKYNWKAFINQRGLNQNSLGVYLPRNQIAIIKDSKQLSLFHEYFGHGLYCEQSLAGKKLVDLERQLLKEEEQEFEGRQFVLEDVKKFREHNQTFQELDKFMKENLTKYELFAIWTEYLLSGEFGIKQEFEKKYGSFSKQNKESIDSVINFSEQYGNLATFYAQDLARRTTPERVKRLLGEVCGDKFKEVNLALLCGSKKEFSDIDVYLVSKNIQRIDTPWLDVTVADKEKFERQIKLFDVEVTHPIMVGEFISGDKEYLNMKRQQLSTQPITQEAINHNLIEAEKQEKIAQEYPEESEKRKDALGYAKTSRSMAYNLQKRKRRFTKDELLLYSHSEESIELKGGQNNVRTISL